MKDARGAVQRFSPESVTLRRGWMSYARAAGSLLATAGVLATAANTSRWPVALAGGVLFFATRFFRPLAGWVRPELEVSADGIRLAHEDGGEVWSRSRLSRGIVLPRRRVRFDLSDASVLEVALSDDSEDRLLAAVGFGPAHRVWSTHVRSMAFFSTFGVLVMLMLAALAGGAGALIGMLVGEPLAACLAAFGGILVPLVWAAKMWPAKLVLGADGALVGTPWSERLIPYDSLEGATLADGVWRFVLRGGEELRFATDWDPDEQASLSRWLETALSVQRSAHELAKVEVWVDRAGRTTDRWVAGLRRLLQATADYRNAAPDRDAVCALLTSGGAPAHQRVAAAIALCANGEDEDRERVRVAADATVQPGLRDALQRVAAGEEDEVVAERLEALEGLDTARARSL